MSEVLHRLATKESVDALTAAIEALPNETQEAADNANAAAASIEGSIASFHGALSDNAFRVEAWENGSIKDTSGENVTSSERIRLKDYFDKTVKKIYSTVINGRFALYAWDADGDYVGAWDDNNHVFSKGGTGTFQSQFNMASYYSNSNYAGYQYKLVYRIANASVQVDDVSGVCMETYVADFPGIEANIAENQRNISKLETNDLVTNLSKANNINAAILWEGGGIYYATGANVSSSERARSKYYLPTNALSFDFGENSFIRGLFLYAYDLEGNYIGGFRKENGGSFVKNGTETGYISEYGQINLGKIFSAYPGYRFRAQIYVRNEGSAVTQSEYESWTMTSILNDENECVKVIQYNIGKFNMGNSGGLSTDVEEKIANYKEFFADVNPDFMFLQEYTQYIDSGEHYATDATLFTPVFFTKSYSEKETVIMGQRKINGTRFTYIHTSGDNPSWVIYGETIINGKSVAVVSGAMSPSAPEGIDHLDQGIRALTKLTTDVLSSYQYAIIGMDCNCLSQEEATAFLNFMKEKGYRSGNWDHFGYKNTYNLSSQMYKAIDNVFVKGDMRITSFKVPDVYADLSSDHFPIVAEIRL